MAPFFSAPLYRPPAEADSLIFQAAYGCPNNTCSFCGMYKGRPYRERALPDLFSEIDSAQGRFPETLRIFLADGDVMAMEFSKLERILARLNEAFPRLARIGMYANSRSLCSKTLFELERLKSLKLSTVYLGLESGSDAVLLALKKKDTAEDAVRAAVLTRRAGIKLSVMVLIGAGGKALSAAHALESARILNRMQPPLLSMLTLVPVPGTPLWRDVESRAFVPLTREEVLAELRAIVDGLELERTIFRCNHTSNPLPLEGRLPRDKSHLLMEIDRMLADKDFLNEESGLEPWML